MCAKKQSFSNKNAVPGATLSPALAAMMAPPKENDVCMVYITALYLKEYIGEHAAILFLKDQDVFSLVEHNPNVQRVFINRYFTGLLLRYRAKTNVPVNSVLTMLVNDGYTEDWFTLFRIHVIPFLKNNDVYNIVFKA